MVGYDQFSHHPTIAPKLSCPWLDMTNLVTIQPQHPRLLAHGWIWPIWSPFNHSIQNYLPMVGYDQFSNNPTTAAKTTCPLLDMTNLVTIQPQHPRLAAHGWIWPIWSPSNHSIQNYLPMVGYDQFSNDPTPAAKTTCPWLDMTNLVTIQPQHPKLLAHGWIWPI